MNRPKNIQELIIRSIVARDKSVTELRERVEILEERCRKYLCKECHTPFDTIYRALRCEGCKYRWCRTHDTELIEMKPSCFYCRECASKLCVVCDRDGAIYKCDCGNLVCDFCIAKVCDYSGKVYCSMACMAYDVCTTNSFMFAKN
jgi:hypothetical protein